MTTGWLAFWDGSHSIYVSARHKDVHYRLIAEEIAALVPGPQARVLDYGCGEALHADLVAAAAGELLLCEGAPRLRAGIAARLAESKNSKIRAVTPQEVERLPKNSLDLIVLNSVAQYLTPEEAATLFALFQRLLRPGGVLLVSDVIRRMSRPQPMPSRSFGSPPPTDFCSPPSAVSPARWSRITRVCALASGSPAMAKRP